MRSGSVGQILDAFESAVLNPQDGRKRESLVYGCPLGRKQTSSVGHIRAADPRDNEDLVVKSTRVLLKVSWPRLDAGTERSVRTDSVIRSYNSVRTDTFQPNPMC